MFTVMMISEESLTLQIRDQMYSLDHQGSSREGELKRGRREREDN